MGIKKPARFSVGKILLADSREVLGILGESYLCEGKQEITHLGRWREYKALRYLPIKKPRSCLGCLKTIAQSDSGGLVFRCSNSDPI
jgi:hypothetical protein